MKILVFKTDLKTKKKVKLIAPILNQQSAILDWCVDREDIDNVLRIESTNTLTENGIIDLLKTQGIFCKALSDEIPA